MVLLSLIKNNEKFIDKWISEKDNGIYDAFNKEFAYLKVNMFIY